METTGQNSDHQTEDISDDFISGDTYTAVAPHESFPDSFEWPAEMIDDYENVIAPGLRYTGGRFMKKVDDLVKGFLYELSKKKTLFFKESVVHPFVQFKGHKKGIFFFYEEYVEVLN